MVARDPTPSGSACPDEARLLDFAQGTATPQARHDVQRHVADCELCSHVVAMLLVGVEPPSSGQPAPGPDRYELRHVIGSGAMGSVFAAYDRVLEREVALKAIAPSDDVGSTGRQRAVDEAKALAKVVHPNVVRVYDVLALDGDDVISMELVDGPSLKRWLDAEPRPRDEVVRHFIQCARGLHAAHQAGVVHRDFKPANVIVGKDGLTRVVDFGVSRDVGFSSARLENPDEQQTLRRAGTPRYMAPEALRQTKVDARSDQYAWGVALYEALTREQPFTGPLGAERLEQMELAAFQHAPAFRKLPRRLRAVLLRALAPNRDQRFPDMAAAAAALEPPRWGWPAAVAALAILAVALPVAVRAPRPGCDGAGAPMDGTWSPARRARLDQALRALAVPYRDALAQGVASAVDAWTHAWRAEALRACDAVRVDPSVPAAVVTARHACLDRTRAELDAQLAALERLDVAAAPRALNALGAVSDPRACARVEQLLELEPRPAGDAGVTAGAVERDVDALAAELELGRYDETHQRCPALLARVEAVGWRPLAARALRVCGLAAFSAKRADAQGWLADGLKRAIAGNDFAGGVLSAAALVRVQRLVEPARTGPSVVEAWLTTGEALAERGHLLGRQEYTTLLLSRALVAEYVKDFEAARRWGRRAVENAEAGGAEASLDANRARGIWASAEAALGDDAKAAALIAQASAGTEAQLGRLHPAARQLVITRASVAFRAGRFEEALALSQDARQRAAELGEDPTLGLLPRFGLNVAEAALAAGQLELASREATVALDALRATGRDVAKDFPAGLVLAAEVALALGRWDDACGAAATLVKPGEPGAGAEVAARAEWIRARCAHHATPSARALQERAAALRPSLTQDSPVAKRDMQRVLDAADAGR